MNTTQIKRFSQDARNKLITLVGGKLEVVLTQDSAVLRAKADTINKLKNEIKSVGREALIDKVAYTWFNRLVALRFMDANDFQPLGINILSPAPETSHASPQILSDIQAGIFPEDLKALDHTYISNVLSGVTASNNPDNDIYRHILIAVCNDLHRIFPFLFERIDDYTELLLPDDLTSPFSIVADVVNGMSVDDCREVEIIGWLYQFYISEKKDKVFASKSKIKKEDIPAATQLFTPRWIVEYMVQNTVGKLWLQNNPNSNLKEHMPYYIESSAESTSNYLTINSAEEIKLLDQACGSGHILVYGFELLTKIYEEQGYSFSDIPTLIIENNLYGMEIDERAAQLAAFAITMKARQYYRRFFRKVAIPHILCYEDIKLTADEVSSIIDKYNINNKEAFKADLKLLEQATNLGSLIQPKTDRATLVALQQTLDEEGESNAFWQQTQIKLRKAVKQLTALIQKYHCVVDNPPYMISDNMNIQLYGYVSDKYHDAKSDLMACFMEAGVAALYDEGFLGMINQHSWMFLSSYKNLRNKIIDYFQVESLIHLGSRTFPEISGEVVQSTSFILLKSIPIKKSIYLRLIDFNNTEEKRLEALDCLTNRFSKNKYHLSQNKFKLIPASRFGYWFNDYMLNTFNNEKLGNLQEVRAGVLSGNDPIFVKNWNEVAFSKIGFDLKGHREFLIKNFKWIPITNGGSFRKWFGNYINIMNLEKNGKDIKARPNNNHRLRDGEFYFKLGINWTLQKVRFSVRESSQGILFGNGSRTIFTPEHEFKYYIGLFNSKVVENILAVYNPTTNFVNEDIKQVPIRFQNSIHIEQLVENCISISKCEWNSHETSWDFQKNELIRLEEVNLESAVNSYKDFWNLQFHTLHQNEEELNRQFIEIYGLQDELTPDVPLEDITILKDESEIVNGQLVFKENELIQQLISYAVGCVFGRYSLDKEKLILANQGETFANFLSKVEKAKEELLFVPDEDNVIPVLDEEWFDDDIVSQVKAFVRAVWGEASYNDNIHYIEEIIGKDLHKYLTKDFYKDHIKRYKKRPIYWMFSSPKGHFNVLIYMHRYTPDTLNFILNSYLRPFIEKVRNDLQRQEDIIITGSATEQGRARKRQDKLKDILIDCEAYEYDMLFPLAGERIVIDLDDGVLVNYNKFGNAIASVPGLNDAKTKKKVKGFDWIDTSTIK